MSGKDYVHDQAFHFESIRAVDLSSLDSKRLSLNKSGLKSNIDFVQTPIFTIA